MSETKTVQLTMSDTDLKAFSRGVTRRRRVKRSEANAAEEAMILPYGGGSTIQVEKSGVDIASLPSPAAPPAVTIPVVAAPAALPAVPVPAASTTTVVGGGEPAPAPVIPNITLQAKKITPVTPAAQTVPTPAPVPVAVVGGEAKIAAKIIPTKKRIMAAPAAQTLKKPRLVVPLANSAITSPINGTEVAKMGGVAPASAPRKRRFTERKISIEVKSAKATRKHRRNLKHKIASMPIASVKKLLLRKGVLKPKEDGKMPPDDMMRAMLKDYLLLHAAD